MRACVCCVYVCIWEVGWHASHAGDIVSLRSKKGHGAIQRFEIDAAVDGLDRRQQHDNDAGCVSGALSCSLSPPPLFPDGNAVMLLYEPIYNRSIGAGL